MDGSSPPPFIPGFTASVGGAGHQRGVFLFFLGGGGWGRRRVGNVRSTISKEDHRGKSAADFDGSSLSCP